MIDQDKIIIKGAREHNLKNIDLEIPRNALNSYYRFIWFWKIFISF